MPLMGLTDVKLGAAVGALLSAAIVMTNVALPAMTGHQTPDTALGESIGWLLVIAMVAWVGFRRVRRTSSVRQAALAGGIVAFVAFALAMTTFLVIDNLFLGIVSRQPEKIWLFEHSGYRDMRTYLNHANLRAFWSVLPVIALIGAVCGGAGGFLNLVTRRTQGPL
jgi:hypothetical protein